MPSIVAGIKTSAVIAVGTATVGALVGAGGFGQPILTGIRLDDFGLILQGAMPAAVMAIGLEALLGAVERRVVPRGLRPPRYALQSPRWAQGWPPRFARPVCWVW